MRRRVWMAALLVALVALSVRALTVDAQTVAVDDHYGFFSFWQANGGETILGRPLTDPLEENGLTVQYFERARLEYHADSDAVLLGLIGRERTQWRTFPPQPAGAEEFHPEGSEYALRGAFRAFWENNGGAAIFGLPISPAFWENTPTGRFQVQYFERAQFIHHPLYAGQPGEIELAPLGREVAAAHGLIEGSIGTSPELFSFEPVAPAPIVTAAPEPDQPEVEQPAAPKPIAKPAEPKPAESKPAAASPAPPASVSKSIEVDLTKQWLYAYENGVQVFDAPVATGKDGFNTPAGSYAIYAKVPLQTMRGSLNGETWVVPNVPHAMYYNGSVALHGTYWHNLFGTGTRISHGCVNLPLDAAAWLYDWARIGTPVEVHY